MWCTSLAVWSNTNTIKTAGCSPKTCILRTNLCSLADCRDFNATFTLLSNLCHAHTIFSLPLDHIQLLWDLNHMKISKAFHLHQVLLFIYKLCQCPHTLPIRNSEGASLNCRRKILARDLFSDQPKNSRIQCYCRFISATFVIFVRILFLIN